jgi:hypothetical protein
VMCLRLKGPPAYLPPRRAPQLDARTQGRIPPGEQHGLHCMSVCLSVCLSVCVYVCIYVFVYFYLFISLRVCGVYACENE